MRLLHKFNFKSNYCLMYHIKLWNHFLYIYSKDRSSQPICRSYLFITIYCSLVQTIKVINPIWTFSARTNFKPIHQAYDDSEYSINWWHVCNEHILCEYGIVWVNACAYCGTFDVLRSNLLRIPSWISFSISKFDIHIVQRCDLWDKWN